MDRTDGTYKKLREFIMKCERWRAVRMMAREKMPEVMNCGSLIPQNFGNMNSFDTGQEKEEERSQSLNSADKRQGHRWQRQRHLF